MTLVDQDENRPLLQLVLEAGDNNGVFISQNVRPASNPGYRWFKPQKQVFYDPLCDDFGPFKMTCIIRFIKMLDKEISLESECKIVYLVEPGIRALTNAIFLLGAYMIVKLDFSSRRTARSFHWLEESSVVPFRDATYAPPDFDLKLMDCWQALERGKSIGWIALPSQPAGIWGKIDPGEYEQYDDPMNADLHEVVPDKLVAFKGPAHLGGLRYLDDARGYRYFSPDFYIDIFKVLKVTDVIQLNEPEYDGGAFQKQGIKHHALEFQDCTAPPPEVVAAFFKAVDQTAGVVAIHCKAGLGRTGTLIALYLMRTHGFAAREAIGWVRIMRPGSIIGEQQHYLCHIESCVVRALSESHVRAPPSLPTKPDSKEPPGKRIAATAGAAAAGVVAAADLTAAAVGDLTEGYTAKGRDTSSAVLARQVADGMVRRCSLRRRSGPTDSDGTPGPGSAASTPRLGAALKVGFNLTPELAGCSESGHRNGSKAAAGDDCAGARTSGGAPRRGGLPRALARRVAESESPRHSLPASLSEVPRSPVRR